MVCELAIRTGCIYYILDAPGFHYSQCSLWILHGAFLRMLARIRAHEEGPAPAKAERGHVQVGVF
jgi:hypothetical protein